MEIKGVIFKELPEVSGQGAKGLWRKREYILDIPGQYSKKLCFELWGDKIDEYNLTEGQQITAQLDIESTEYNNRWYTKVKAWKIEIQGAQSERRSDPLPPVTTFSEEDSADLPF